MHLLFCQPFALCAFRQSHTKKQTNKQTKQSKIQTKRLLLTKKKIKPCCAQLCRDELRCKRVAAHRCAHKRRIAFCFGERRRRQRVNERILSTIRTRLKETGTNKQEKLALYRRFLQTRRARVPSQAGELVNALPSRWTASIKILIGSPAVCGLRYLRFPKS